MMRNRIAALLLVGGLIYWLVMAGVLFSERADPIIWVVWALMLPALILVVALIATSGKPKQAPPQTKVLNVRTTDPLNKPRFGEMEDNR